jgi:twitching motility two-component system response regulator PilG
MSNLVMIVDDSLTVRKILEVSLKRAGAEVIAYTDGITALDALTTGKLTRLPDVIILDIMMPKLNGFTVARLLRSKQYLRHIPIIMLTSRNSMLSQVRGRMAGATEYITKPFKTQELVEVVNRFLKPEVQQPPSTYQSQAW